jgi:hypothetical protein
LKYIYDKKIKSKRIAVTTDPFNWIILYGSARQSDRTFQRKAEHCYYSDFASMIISLHKKLLKFNLNSLECEDLISALNESYEFVEKMALEIADKMGVQIGCR